MVSSAAHLQAIAPIPTKVDWHVAPIRTVGLVLVADDGAEDSLPIMEAVASQHGEVIATGSVAETFNGREFAGCLVDPLDQDLGKAAAALRMSYALAINAGTDEPPAEIWPAEKVCPPRHCQSVFAGIGAMASSSDRSSSAFVIGASIAGGKGWTETEAIHLSDMTPMRS